MWKRLQPRGSRGGCSVEEVAAPRKPMWHHWEAAPQRKARHLRDEHPAEPAASGRALFVK